ncbi:hypothetical protein D3C72_1129820 [compost metagenome]
MPRFPGLEGLDHHRQEALLDAAFNQQARAGNAHFALVKGDGRGCRIGSRLQVRGVSEDNVRALATGFQPDPLHVRLTGIDHQLLGNARGAGEHQRVDIHVQGQGLANGVTVSRKDVEHASRDTGFECQLGDTDCGQG